MTLHTHLKSKSKEISEQPRHVQRQMDYPIPDMTEWNLFLNLSKEEWER